MLPTIFNNEAVFRHMERDVAAKCGIKAAILNAYITHLALTLVEEEDSPIVKYFEDDGFMPGAIPWVKLSQQDFSEATNMSREETRTALKNLLDNEVIRARRDTSNPYDRTYYYSLV